MDKDLLGPFEFSGPAVGRDNLIREQPNCTTCANYYTDAGYEFCRLTGHFAQTERLLDCGSDAKLYVPGSGD